MPSGRWRLAGIVVVAVCLAAPTAGQTAVPDRPADAIAALSLGDGTRKLPGTVAPDDRALRSVLRRSNRRSMGQWWAEATGGSGLPPVAGRHVLSYLQVSSYAMTAYSMATSLATGAYDPAGAGVSRQEALDRTRDIVVALASTHHSVKPDGWGPTWQSALWSSLGGTAAWLIAPSLNPVEQALVDRMLLAEAEATLLRPIHYYRNRAGKILTPGDTGAEELAWDAQLLHLVSELFPDNPQRAQWQDAAYRRMVGAYARPPDTGRPMKLHGKRVGDWLGGTNAEHNAMVVNHGRLYPDYSTCIVHNLFAVPISALLDRPAPMAARFNADLVYGALSTVDFDPSHFRRPGGTAYRKGSGAIYYAQGADWGETRQMAFAALDSIAGSLDLDTMSKGSGEYWEALHIQVVRDMQGRFTTGQTYGKGDGDNYPLREEWIGMQSAFAYLTEYVAVNDLVRWHNAPPS